MNLLDRVLGHDDWTTRQVLAACGILSPAQLQQPLALGHATIAGTVRHIVNNVAIWTDLMMERPLSAMAGWSDTEVATWYAVWVRAYADFAICSRQMAHAGRLDESISTHWIPRRRGRPSEAQSPMSSRIICTIAGN